MNHPYAPWIISALIGVTAACLILIWHLIRRDRREADQHRWDKSTRDLPDFDTELRELLDTDG